MNATAAEVVVVQGWMIGGEQGTPAFPPDLGVLREVIHLSALLPADINGARGAGAKDAWFQTAAKIPEEENRIGGSAVFGPNGESVERVGCNGLVGAGVQYFSEEERDEEAGGPGPLAARPFGGDVDCGEEHGEQERLLPPSVGGNVEEIATQGKAERYDHPAGGAAPVAVFDFPPGGDGGEPLAEEVAIKKRAHGLNLRE